MYNPEITALQADVSKKLSDFMQSFHDYYFSLIVDFKQSVEFPDDFMRFYRTANQGVVLRHSLEQLNQIEGHDNPQGLNDYKTS